MNLSQFAQEYSELPPAEQSHFAQTVRRLLSDGIVWREEEQDRPIFAFLMRRRELVADYLAVAGWELRHEERLGAFHVVHRDGAHRRRLSRDATIWLLLLRLIYAEKCERLEVSLTRYPVIELSEVIQRYAEFFPGQQLRKRSSLQDALRSFQALKLVRAADGGQIRSGQHEQLIELLPTLEIVVPSGTIAALSEQLRSYSRIGADGEAADEGD